MKKVNTSEVEEQEFESPKGVYAMRDINLSHALGREADSTDINRRHPFDVEICRIPAGKKMCPYHSLSAQWEFYHVISGTGTVRDVDGHTAVKEGDAFLFKPGEAHQIINDSDSDLVFYIVADNPIGEHCHYPDSNKWLVALPDKRLIGSDAKNYFEGEE